MNVTAAFFSAGVWMTASAVWQLAYRSRRDRSGSNVALQLGLDVVPAVVVSFIIAWFA